MDVSEKGPKELPTRLCELLVEKINEFVAPSPANRLSFMDDYIIFDPAVDKICRWKRLHFPGI